MYSQYNPNPNPNPLSLTLSLTYSCMHRPTACSYSALHGPRTARRSYRRADPPRLPKPYNPNQPNNSNPNANPNPNPSTHVLTITLTHPLHTLILYTEL